MTDSSQIIIDSEQSIIKLKNALDQLLERSGDTNDASSILSDAMSLFKTFFDNIGNPEFTPIQFKNGDTPRSLDYNSNLKQIYNDLSRFYKELENLKTATTKSYNYSQVVTNEIRKRAESIAGIVLDLNILSGFTRGDVIVAGDDFINLDKVDSSAGLSASKVELISNGSGVSLARSGTTNITSDPRIKVQVIPLSPQGGSSGDSAVNTRPTAGNFNRFYEGCYYSLLGQARPEGGRFNIKSITLESSPQLNPNPGSGEETPTTSSSSNNSVANLIEKNFSFFKRNPFGSKRKDLPTTTTTTTEGPTPDPNAPESFFLEFGASEEEKEVARRKMFDNNPDTFWECEYVISVENDPLAKIEEAIVVTTTDERPETENPSAASIEIDVNSLNLEAIERDTLDFSIDIIVTLPEQQSVNFVSINPVLFSKNAFIDVVDISTANQGQGTFVTVPGWESLKFAKTITPEANEFLTDSQVAASLSPSRFNYTGQGIYPFPTTIAKRVKITLLMRNPSAQVYEKTYALLRNVVDVETTITTTRTSRKFGF